MSKRPQQSRREFLSGRSVDANDSDSNNDSGKEATDSASSTSSQSRFSSDCVQYFSHRAMACDFEVYFNQGQYSSAGEAAFEWFQEVDRCEATLTIYREDSPLSSLNRIGANQTVEIQPMLAKILGMSRELSQATLGAFDITTNPLTECWGFHRRQGQMPSETEVLNAKKHVGIEQWQFDRKTAKLSKQSPDVSFNLGAIGKGFALDLCRETMARNQIEDYLIHGGNSSVLAGGNRLRQDEQNGWWVSIAHPVYPDQEIAQFRLRDQCLGTSGTRRQGFVHRGQWYGHIIDPRTGYPARQVYSATAIADSAARADALSTAFYVMGPDTAEAFCSDHPDVGAFLVLPDDKKPFAIRSFNLDENHLRTRA